MPRASEQVMMKTGQKAIESGRLKCTNCGEQINIKEGEHIPPCPKCANTEFESAGSSESSSRSGSRSGSSRSSR